MNGRNSMPEHDEVRTEDRCLYCGAILNSKGYCTECGAGFDLEALHAHYEEEHITINDYYDGR